MPRVKKIETPEEQKTPSVGEIWEAMQKTKREKVRLEQVYLDPNNPRLEVLKTEPIPDDRLIEPGIQQECLEQLKSLGIKDLVESMRTSGFCTIDRVVLRPLDEDKYIVVEGNRRIAALQTLRDEYKRGRIPTLSESILNGILEFEAVVYEGQRRDIAWIVQGFRHAPEAIMQWDDFSKAKFFAELEMKGKKATEIGRMFTVKPRADVSKLIRSYYGFQQARETEDYGDQLAPDKHFSFFTQIVFAKPALRDEWLDWNEAEKRFRNTENLNRFVPWVVNGKIDISTTTRDYLPQLLLQPEHKDTLEAFEREKELKIHECCEKMMEAKPKPPPDIRGILGSLRRMKDEIDMLPLTPIKRLGKTPEEKEQKTQILTLLNELVEALKAEIRMLSAE